GGPARGGRGRRGPGSPVRRVALGPAVGQDLEQMEHVQGPVRGPPRESLQVLRVEALDAGAGFHAATLWNERGEPRPRDLGCELLRRLLLLLGLGDQLVEDLEVAVA